MFCVVTKTVLLMHSFVLIIWQKLNTVVEGLQKFAVVDRLEDKSAISLVGNAEMSPFILEKVITTYPLN